VQEASGWRVAGNRGQSSLRESIERAVNDRQDEEGLGSEWEGGITVNCEKDGQ